MKKLLVLSTILYFTLTLNAQTAPSSSTDSIEMYKFGFEMIKTHFEKPIYNFTYEKFDAEETFRKINLGINEMESVFDTLQSTSTITINKKKGSTEFNFSAKLPENFNFENLWRIGKIEFGSYNLYNKFNQKIELKKYGNTNFRRLKSEYTNNKLVPNNPIYAFHNTQIKDTTNVDSLSYGNVEYEICFVSD